MQSLSNFIDQVRAILIETENKKPRHEIYSQFINECIAHNLTEDAFYKDVLRPAHKSIDWDAIEKEKVQREEAQKKIEEASVQKQKQTESELIYINRLIKIAFEDGIVEAEELAKIFSKVEAFSQDTNVIAEKINALLDEGHYKSYPKADLEKETLKDILVSASWYNPKEYANILPPPKPQQAPLPPPPPPPPPTSVIPLKQPEGKTSYVLVFVIVAAIIAAIYFYNREEPTPEYTTTETTTDTSEIPGLGKRSKTNRREQPSKEENSSLITDKTTTAEEISNAESKESSISDTNSTGAVGDEEKNIITNNLKEFYDYENNGDISNALNYFSYPVNNYYGDKKCPCSKEVLEEIYSTSYNQTFNYHKIDVNWSSMAVEKKSYGYKITVSASYEFHKSSWPAERENQTNYPTIVINMNDEYKITSVYQQ